MFYNLPLFTKISFQESTTHIYMLGQLPLELSQYYNLRLPSSTIMVKLRHLTKFQKNRHYDVDVIKVSQKLAFSLKCNCVYSFQLLEPYKIFKLWNYFLLNEIQFIHVSLYKCLRTYFNLHQIFSLHRAEFHCNIILL